MEWDIEYLPQYNVLAVRTRGTLHAAASERLIAAGAAAAAQHGCTRHLVDHRHASLALSALDSLQQPDICRAHGMPPTTRIALLFSRLSDQTRLLEAAAVNQGISVRAFTSEDEAMAWLCGASFKPQS